jgi:hypothetical protein
VKIGISITAATPAAIPIRRGPPPVPSIRNGTKPSVDDVAHDRSSSPPRNGRNRGDARNAPPIAPNRDSLAPVTVGRPCGNRSTNIPYAKVSSANSGSSGPRPTC